jgi:XRE family aerobic/anaerobic benzoate catabolism transcriptional regulator
LQPLPEHLLARIRHQLSKDLERSGQRGRQCIALIGLRGAGKSTLGARLGKLYQVPFIELDREVERETGTGWAEIFLLHGQAGYLQLERRVLQRVLDEHPRSIIATGGSIVTDPATYQFLLQSCFTVWVKAAPEEHMARVVAQGDLRPMHGNAQAMKDLRRILDLREPLYRQADLVIDTHGHSVEQSFQQLRNLLAQQA